METQIIHTRVDPHIKQNAESVFQALGINTSEAIRMFLVQVALQQGLPFDVKIPNQKTRQAIKEAQSKENLKSYSAQEFHELLNTL